jgi:hypothetical protein
MNCGLRHFKNDVMQLSYGPTPICSNFSFSFLKDVIRDQRWSTTPFFVVNIIPPFGEFSVSLRHILPIHNVTIKSNNLFVNFCWMFTFCFEKPYTPHIWQDFGLALPFQTRFTQTKSVLLLPNEHGSQVKDQGQWKCCPTKHKKFYYRPARDIFFLSRHTSYM